MFILCIKMKIPAASSVRGTNVGFGIVHKDVLIRPWSVCLHECRQMQSKMTTLSSHHSAFIPCTPTQIMGKKHKSLIFPLIKETNLLVAQMTTTTMLNVLSLKNCLLPFGDQIPKVCLLRCFHELLMLKTKW